MKLSGYRLLLRFHCNWPANNQGFGPKSTARVARIESDCTLRGIAEAISEKRRSLDMAVSSTNTASTSLSCVVTVGDWLAGFEHPL